MSFVKPKVTGSIKKNVRREEKENKPQLSNLDKRTLLKTIYEKYARSSSRSKTEKRGVI